MAKIPSVVDSLSGALSPRVVLALLALLAVAFIGASQVQATKQSAAPWLNPVVTPDEVNGMVWVRANLAPRTVFATGIFEGELLMGKARMEGTLGGDWAIVPDVITRMSDVQYRIFGAKDSKEAWTTAHTYNASYVWVPNRQTFEGYEWKVPAAVFDNATYFQKVYDRGILRIYRVNEKAA
ncbi:hypothetical protein HY994_03135 [Candidatus Micrarchaeota archaeon]|nr:hypothetical protein [Candidatus Micrarchaeota archaeon]